MIVSLFPYRDSEVRPPEGGCGAINEMVETSVLLCVAWVAGMSGEVVRRAAFKRHTRRQESRDMAMRWTGHITRWPLGSTSKASVWGKMGCTL
jgi:hypothetical protein